MTPAEIQRLIADLPLGREIVVIIARAPGLAMDSSSRVDVVSVGPWTRAATESESCNDPGKPVALAPPAVARHLLRAAANARPSIAEWAAKLNGAVSAREIQRAAKIGVLAAEPRGTGRGHGAVVITPNAMVEYLETRERVISGEMPAPAWFAKVVRGGQDAND